MFFQQLTPKKVWIFFGQTSGDPLSSVLRCDSVLRERVAQVHPNLVFASCSLWLYLLIVRTLHIVLLLAIIS